MKTHGHALVIGGSLAGLLAARVLSDHFRKVTLLERDHLSQDDEPRKGVPQGRHVHVVLRKGQQILDRLFPDLLPALHDAGAIEADMGDEFRWHHFGVWKQRFRSGIPILFVYRPSFEHQVARRVAALPNVEVIDECAVENLLADDQGDRRVTGVTLRRRGSESAESLTADLVVDASGRGSQTPRWLESIGFPTPDESVIGINVGYSSRIYRRPHPLPDWQALFVVPRPPGKRAAAIFPIEGDRWLVTLAGWMADYPPVDEEGYLEFARSLAVPDVHRALQGAEPLTPIVAHKLPSNLRRHYEKLARFPESFIVLGDALCSFNPVYGQGMSVSAMDVAALEGCLREQGRDLKGFSRRFQKRVAKVIDVPWQLATGEDLRFPEATGPRPFGTSFIQWYVGKVHEAAGRDREVAQCFYRVLHLLDKPPLLFRPDVVLRVMLG